MLSTSSTSRGFTIVELLIVIVVIGILAAITIVAYNGISDRAYTAKMLSTANAYANALRMYQADHGTLPPSADFLADSPAALGAAACLGTPDQYPATSIFPAGTCYVRRNGGGTIISSRSGGGDIVNDLSPYMTSLPDPVLRQVSPYSNQYYRGVTYDTTWDGTYTSVVLTAVLPGSDCPSSWVNGGAASGTVFCTLEIKQ